MAISAVILTKNEEKNIEACLKDLLWCDELLVIDDESTDKTAEIAKKHATVIVHPLESDFSKQRNFALNKAKNDWVFFVDADERVSASLAKEIRQAVEKDVDGFYVKREDTMWGKKILHGEQGNMWLLRLGKKSAGKWEGKVHEVWQIKGKIERLATSLLHFPHPTIKEFLQEINTYSTLRAEELHRKGVRAGFWSVILYPKAKFVQDYFVKLGFLDGTRGFILAILMSFHSFLVRGKLWHLTNN